MQHICYVKINYGMQVASSEYLRLAQANLYNPLSKLNSSARATQLEDLSAAATNLTGAGIRYCRNGVHTFYEKKCTAAGSMEQYVVDDPETMNWRPVLSAIVRDEQFHLIPAPLLQEKVTL
jgi:hypothetical protein